MNKNRLILYIILALLIVLYHYLIYTKVIDGFNNINGWTDNLTNKFLKYQNTVFEGDYQFNVSELQKQATPEEVDYLLKTGYWPWPDDLKYLFLDAVARQPIIKAVPGEALDDAMKLYNEQAARRLLAWNTKEGNFLLQGIITPNQTGVNQSFLSRNKDTIKCGKDGLVKTTYNGYSLLTKVETPIANEDIPKEVPGFTFVKNPCNPCVAIDDDFSCPFQINVDYQENVNKKRLTNIVSSDNNNTISTIWAKLWNL